MCFLSKCEVFLFFWSFNILSHGYTRLIINGTANKILYPFWSKCKYYILNVTKISLSCATGANLNNTLYVIRMLPSLQWSLDNKYSQHVHDIYILPAWWVDFFCGFFQFAPWLHQKHFIWYVNIHVPSSPMLIAFVCAYLL